MTVQEKIKNKAEGFGKLAPVCLEGAEFALESQWISVDEDLPCNHEELLYGNITCPVFGRDKNGKCYVTLMGKFDKQDFILGDITHWMSIPELPKEQEIIV